MFEINANNATIDLQEETRYLLEEHVKNFKGTYRCSICGSDKFPPPPNNVRWHMIGGRTIVTKKRIYMTHQQCEADVFAIADKFGYSRPDMLAFSIALAEARA